MVTNTKRSWKLQEFTAHKANVNCLALGHKSGRVLVTGGDDKKVNLWAIGKENCIMSLGGHTTPVECVKFCHTEDMVCAGSQAGILKLWDLEAAKLFRTLTSHKGGIKCIDFHPYGDVLASGSLDTSIKMWDNRNKSCIFTYKGHQQTVNSIKFSPDGQWIASGGEEGSVKIWDIRNGRVLEDLNEHSGAVTDVEFHPHEFLLASSSADRSINFWDLENFHMVSKTEKESSTIRCLYFSLDGKCLFGGCAEQLKVYGWEPARTFDTVTVGWGKVQDMTTAQDQLIGASFFMTQVSICVVDVKKVSPFVAPSTSQQQTSQTSPFSHGQGIRKSFSKQKPKEAKQRKQEVETISEKYNAESEDEASNPFIPNVDDYEAVFKPHRALNRSPPLHPFSEPTSEEDLSASSLTPKLSNKRANFSYADETNFEVVTATQSVSLPEHRVPSPVVPAPKPVKYQSQIHVSKSAAAAASSQHSSGYSSLKSSTSRETLRRANSCKNNASTSTDSEPASKPAQNHINWSESSLPDITTSRLPKPPPSYKRTLSNKPEDPAVTETTAPVPYTTASDVSPSSESHDNEIIPASCSSPVDLQLADFLPSSYRNGLHSQQSHSNLSENEIITSLTRNHEMVLTILKIRQRNLQIVYSLWHNQDLKCALEGAVSMNDQAVLVDVLSAINKRPSLWNLDICVVLLPAIHNLLHSKYEMYMTVCCDSLKLMLKNFASVIRTNVQWSAPTLGVDISKEERYAKCVKCYESLIAIRTFLLKRQTMQGKLGQSFREVQTLLYSIEK